MSFREKLEGHPIYVAVGIVISSVALTFSTLDKISIEPLKEKAESLAATIDDLSKDKEKRENIMATQAIEIQRLLMSMRAAGYTEINGNRQDYETLRVAPYKEKEGPRFDLWRRWIDWSPGEKVSFAVYYHITGQEVARDVHISFAPLTEGRSTCHAFEATITSANAPPVKGVAWVASEHPIALKYSPNTIVWRPQQYKFDWRELPFGQSDKAVFSSDGLSIGDVEPGWSAQGSLIFSFEAAE